MKIGLVVPGGVDPGGERRVLPWLLWLIRRMAREHEVHVFALFQDGAPERYELEGATVHNAGGHRVAWRIAALLRREHARARFDAFHGFWAWPSGLVATWAGRLLRVPSVVHLCGGELVAMPDIDYGEQRTTRGRRRVRSALRHASCIAAQSEPMVDAAAAAGLAAVRIPLGVSLEDWPPVEPRRREPGRPARLIRVGSLSPVKDTGLLIGMAATLAAGGEDFVLDIVGEDRMGGHAAMAAAEAGLGDRIRFHGFVTQRELRPLILSADLMIQTSRHEAGPIVMLEAAASGVPTVGTAVGHNAEWSPDAAVSTPAEPAALAAAVRALLRHEDRRLGVAELAGRRAIAEDADWTVARLTRLYRETSKP